METKKERNKKIKIKKSIQDFKKTICLFDNERLLNTSFMFSEKDIEIFKEYASSFFISFLEDKFNNGNPFPNRFEKNSFSQAAFNLYPKFDLSDIAIMWWMKYLYNREKYRELHSRKPWLEIPLFDEDFKSFESNRKFQDWRMFTNNERSRTFKFEKGEETIRQQRILFEKYFMSFCDFSVLLKPGFEVRRENVFKKIKKTKKRNS